MNEPSLDTALSIQKQFGTPAFLYDTKKIFDRYQSLRKKLTSLCDIFYSMKANPLLGICQYLASLHVNCEVSSKNECITALLAGFDSNQIIFVGPAKSPEDIEYCLMQKIKAIVCESMDEMALIDAIAKKHQEPAHILLRINPDFFVEKAPIKMSGVATQFGIAQNEVIEKINDIKQYQHIIIDGIHIFNASRVLDSVALLNNVAKILTLSESLSKLFQTQWQYIDVGGGLGIPYFQDENRLNENKLLDGLNVLFLKYHQQYPGTRFFIELGRYLVAESGCLITSVCTTKKSHDKNYIIVDGGMHCHLGVSGLGSFVHRNFPAKLLSLHNTPSFLKKIYQVVGPLCTPGDMVLRDFKCAAVSRGDFIVIFNTGAYGVSASPTRFLSHGAPPEIILHNGEYLLARKKEAVNDILLNQIDLKSSFLIRRQLCSTLKC